MSARRLPPPTLLRSPIGDPELLRACAQAADPAAFAELVRRYGPLARRAATEVCPAAADDVAQATLTLLGRKARTLATRESAAGWVFESARRLAMKARTSAARRAKHEARAALPAPSPDPLDALSFGEVRAAVAEEVARLPDELRVPLVLCYWRGDSQPAAAQRLGCSLSTLKRRLDAGRDRLAARLARRGFAASAVLAVLTGLACSSSWAATPVPVIPARPHVPTGLPKPVLRGLAASGLVVAGLALGLAPAGDPSARPPSKPVEEAKGPAPLVDAFGDPLPPGAVARLGTVRFRTSDFPKHLAVSPDGKRLVSTAALQHSRLAVWEADTGRPVHEVELPGYPQPEAVCWPANEGGLAAIKTGMKDYVVWQFTDPDAPPPAGDRSNSTGLGTFAVSAFSADGTLIAGGERAGPQGTAGKLQVWPVRSGRPVREATPLFTIDTADGFVALMFTADGKRLVGITQGRQPDRRVLGPIITSEPGARADTARVFVWDVATGKERTTFEIVAGGFGVDYSSRSVRAAVAPDGKTVFTPTLDAHVKAWDLTTGKERFDVAAFGPPGELTRKLLPNVKSQVESLGISPDGKTLIVVELAGRTLGLDAATGKELWRGGRELDYVYALAVFPDGKRFALGHGARQIGVYDAATGKALVEPAGPRGGLTALGITPDGRTAITGGWDNTLHRWDLATGRLLQTVAAESAARVRVGGFSPDGKRGVGRPGLFDTATGKLAVPLDLPGVPPYWTAGGRVAWLPAGSVVVADEESRAARYSADGKKLAEYVVTPPGKPRTGPQVQAVAAAPDGKTVVLAGEAAATHGGMMRSNDGWVTVFDAATGAKLRDWQSKGTGGFTSAAYLPDGSRVVLGRDVSQPPRPVNQPEKVLDLATAVVVFDPASGDAVTPFDAPDPTASMRRVRSWAVSPTGAQVAAVEWDNAITVYETASGGIRRRLLGHRGMVDQVAFTPDGTRLVSVSGDGTGLVWDMTPPRPAAPPAATDADRQKRWAALLASDAPAAHRAMGELAADPAGTVAFLKKHLKPTAAPTDADMDRLMGGLAAPAFADREAAARDLDALGGLAVAKVRDRLPKVTSADVRQRLDEFLKRHDRPGRTTGYRLRELRAAELLEWIGTAEARAVLREWAGRGSGEPR